MSKKQSLINHNQVSLAGEFAVLSQLALRGFDANMTLGNTKGVDILISNPKDGKMYRLEVKTNYQNSRNKPSKSTVHGKTICGWVMDEKHEKIVDDDLFYCFVNIDKNSDNFKFYIVPSKIVANYVREEHQLWLKMKKEENKKVKDMSMRQFRIGISGEKYFINTPFAETYLNNWSFKSND